MGIPSELRDMWVSRRESFLIASPAEERKIVRTKKCTHDGVIAGFKAASIACVASAVPTLAAVRMVPWAKANLNYVAQALIISAASIAAYFITADKTILECARRNAQLEDSLRNTRQ
ncbi:early nodulin-93 [Arachis duranensis]|uniref:Early nodulin-93 n=1 Tax=Arachis duranensis TaxID=130453 RepID=A0A6P4E059_ARADU|nr:early nodulin-93 [Arachis duranensis]XP_057720598.1 early nodulin-93-like [Arachis stenosperma]